MMMVVKLLQRSVLYSAVGIAVLLAALAVEVAGGTGTSHPLWNRDYDWMPTIYLIVIFASALAIARTVVGSTLLRRRMRGRGVSIPVIADLNWGKEYRILVRGR